MWRYVVLLQQQQQQQQQELNYNNNNNWASDWYIAMARGQQLELERAESVELEHNQVKQKAETVAWCMCLTHSGITTQRAKTYVCTYVSVHRQLYERTHLCVMQ